MSDTTTPHGAVIKFKRDVQFPRFSMKAGERWSFIIAGSNVDRIRAIKTGERFNFAGGQCLAQDVDLIYEGPRNLQYSIAAGDIPAVTAVATTTTGTTP